MKFTTQSRYPTSWFVYEHKLRPALLLLWINQVKPRMGCFFTWICRLSWYTGLQKRVGGSVGILCAVIKIPATSPSLVVYKTAAYARCLGGKRLQRACASQLRDDGWEKESALLFLLLQLSQAHMSCLRISWRRFDCVDTLCGHISASLSRRKACYMIILRRKMPSLITFSWLTRFLITSLSYEA